MSDSDVDHDGHDVLTALNESSSMTSSEIPSSHLRVVQVFSLWWEQLEEVMFTSQLDATRCILHIARLLEDSYHVGEAHSRPGLVDEEEAAMLSMRLIRIVVNDFGHVAESMFGQMMSATDIVFLRAGLKMLIAYKQACWRTADDFFIVFPSDLLEAFIAEHATTTDLLFAARLAFLGGELAEEASALSPIPPMDIIGLVIERFKAAKSVLTQRVPEIVSYIDEQHEKTLYVEDSSILIPVPGEPSSRSAEWDADDTADPASIQYQLAIVIGNLRLLSGMAGFTDVLPITVEADLVQECLELLQFPHFSLCVYGLVWFNAALTHKKIAMDFVTLHGVDCVVKYVAETLRESRKKYTELTPYVSFILVALSKHDQVLEALVVDEASARSLFDFGLSLLDDADNLDTQFNIVEWLGACFGLPKMLYLSFERNILALLGEKLKMALLPGVHGDEKDTSLRSTLRKEVMRCFLKFIGVNVVWHMMLSDSIGFEQAMVKHQPTLSLSLAHKNYLNSMIERFNEGGVDKTRPFFDWVFQDMNSVMVVEDTFLATLESKIARHLMNTGVLPFGLTVNLFNSCDHLMHSLLATEEQSAEAQDECVSIMTDVEIKVDTRWAIGKLFVDNNIIPILLKTLVIETKDSTTLVTLLYILELLCFDAGVIDEIRSQQPLAWNDSDVNDRGADISQLKGKTGLEILLFKLESTPKT
jgi:hypothetical protein